jgi:hypothetical protein
MKVIAEILSSDEDEDDDDDDNDDYDDDKYSSVNHKFIVFIYS